MRSICLSIVSFSLLLYSCGVSTTVELDTTTHLNSWNEGPTKKAIIDFVERVTEPSNPDFVEVNDRIAVFDNDGNLWSEQPLYFQLSFALDCVKELSAEHPEWYEIQPFKAVLENDTSEILRHGEHGLIQIVMASHAGMTTAEFEESVENWISNAKHPRFNQPYTALVYQPMLELLDYLREHEFKTFIVSGGGIEFMRPWVEEIYGIPKDQVIGSSIKTVFEMTDMGPVLHRMPEIDFIDDKEGKPVGIHKFIGRKPIFCSGNSDGDLAMMQWTASNDLPNFELYMHHTDAKREWAYDRESHIGKLDKGLDIANESGWSVVDMAKDWKVIYPFELD